MPPLDPVAIHAGLLTLLAAAPGDFESLRGAPGPRPETWAGTVLLPGATVCDIGRTASGKQSDWNYECRWRGRTAEEAAEAWIALETAVGLASDPTWKRSGGDENTESTLTAARVSVRRDDGVRISAVHYSFSTGTQDVVLSVWSPP